MHVTDETTGAITESCARDGARRWFARPWWRCRAWPSGPGSSCTWPVVADGYAAALRRSPGWLWAARAGLATAMVVHVAGVVSLTRTARAARPRHASHRPD